MGYKDMIISALLIGLFTFCFISFIYQTSIDNDSSTLLKDQSLNRTFLALNSSLLSYQSIAQTQQNSSNSDSPTSNLGDIILYSIVGVGRTFTTMITGVYLIIFDSATENLGIPPIVFGVLTTIMIISIIFLMWRLFKSGS